MKKEYKLGERFNFNDSEYEVVKSDQFFPFKGGCMLCDLHYSDICNNTKCGEYDRKDELNIHFKKIIK